MIDLTLRVSMHGGACENAVRTALRRTEGVTRADADYRRGEVRLRFDPNGSARTRSASGSGPPASSPPSDRDRLALAAKARARACHPADEDRRHELLVLRVPEHDPDGRRPPARSRGRSACRLHTRSLKHLDSAAIDRVKAVNLLGTLCLTKTFLPILLARPAAHIVNVSSLGTSRRSPAMRCTTGSVRLDRTFDGRRWCLRPGTPRCGKRAS
ncbi:MAG: SDR family NAD(P)-dependent oxidoreductase [Candidatus Limnocylindria bacterium]